MDTIEASWIRKDSKTIELTWNKRPFKYNCQIDWRGIVFSIGINVETNQFGFERTDSIRYNDKVSQVKFSKHKWMAGHHGDSYPDIHTTTNRIKISAYGGYNSDSYHLVLTDELINSDNNSVHDIDSPFMIIQIGM
jgi:hypothetical protein